MVGAVSIPFLIDILAADLDDISLYTTVTEHFEILMKDDANGVQFSEIIAKDVRLMKVHLNGLKEHSTRQTALKFLNSLVLASPLCRKSVQLHFIQANVGIDVLISFMLSWQSQVSDLLRMVEHIAFDNNDIKNMVVYSGMLERTVQLISEEGGATSGEKCFTSCLTFVKTILDDNFTGQQFILEQPLFNDLLSLLRQILSHDSDSNFSRDRYLATLFDLLHIFLTRDNKYLLRNQTILSGVLFDDVVMCAFKLRVEPAVILLSGLIFGNNSLRLKVFKYEMEGDCLPNILTNMAIASEAFMMAFEALLYDGLGEGYRDGQTMISATLAPGAISPGSIILARLQDNPLHTKKSEPFKRACLMLSYVIFANEDSKKRLKGHILLEARHTILDYMISLIGNCELDQSMMRYVLSTLAVWFEDSPSTTSFVLEERSGVLQNLIQLVQSYDKILSGLAVFTYAVLLNGACKCPSLSSMIEELKSIVTSRIGLNLFLNRLDFLGSSEFMKPQTCGYPILDCFRSQYHQIREIFGKGGICHNNADAQLIIDSVEMKLADSDGSIYHQLLSENQRIKEENSALLRELMNAENENTDLLGQLGNLGEQLSKCQEKSILKSFKSAIGILNDTRASDEEKSEGNFEPPSKIINL